MTVAVRRANLIEEDLDHILAHTGGVWDALRGQSIFVTGGTGFFGRWIVESFAHANRKLNLGARMVVLSRNPESFRAKAPHLGEDVGVHFVTGDVRKFTARAVSEQLGTDAPEAFGFVIHAATEASAKLNAEDPLTMIDTIVQGTRAALEFAVAAGAKRFLLTSSGAVYGRQPATLTHVPEEHAGAPDCTRADAAYGEGKRLAELLCICFQKQHQLEPVLARCFAFLGPFLPLDAHFAIGNFVRDALHGGPIRVAGDGMPYRSYLYAADLAIWLWTLLAKGQPCRPYNVGSEDDRSIRAMAEAVADAAKGTRIEINRPPDPDKPAERYVPATRRAREELGLQERIGLTDAIKRTIGYEQRHAAG